MDLQNDFLLWHFDDTAVEVFEEQSVFNQLFVLNIEDLNEVDVSIDAVLVLQCA